MDLTLAIKVLKMFSEIMDVDHGHIVDIVDPLTNSKKVYNKNKSWTMAVETKVKTYSDEPTWCDFRKVHFHRIVTICTALLVLETHSVH